MLRGRIENSPVGGAIIDHLPSKHWMQDDLAFVLGIDSRAVSHLISGRRALTPAMAVALSVAFKTDVAYWLHLHAQADAQRAQKNPHAGTTPQIISRARLYRIAPIGQMMRRKWIERSRDPAVMNKRLREFFSTGARFWRDSNWRKDWPPARRAWFARVLQIAATQQVGRFSRQAVEVARAHLRGLCRRPESMAGIPAVLASAGIRFVVVERLPPDEVDGATLWLTRDSPVIALSLRDDRIGAVWHTLMCQVEHVALGGSSGRHAWVDPPIGTYSLPKRARDRAKSAEDAASEFLLAASVVPGRGGRYLYRYLDLLVERVNAHPGIVLFQLRRRRVIRPRKTKAEEEVGVRAHLIREALTDGWGHFPKAEPQDLDKTRLRTSCPP